MIGNTGSFMSSTTGGQNGAGPALQRLIALRNQGASPSPMNGNSANPQAVPPAQPSQVSAIPARIPTLRPNAAPAGSPSPLAGGQQPQPQQNPELTIALQALSNFIGSHGKAHEAQHNVPLKNAQAKLIASQAGQQGGE